MSEIFQLSDNIFISPTPAGAYFCVSGNTDVASRKLLKILMMQTETLPLDINELRSRLEMNENELHNLLYRMQELGWLEGLEQKQLAPEGGLEDLLPELLLGLSDSGKVLLADEQGFYISSQGFPHETAEELSALSADIFSMYERHQGLLKNNLSIETSAWGIVDAAGNGQIGFWPLWIGSHRFVLIIRGVPLLNQAALKTLIWLLSIRYSN